MPGATSTRLSRSKLCECGCGIAAPLAQRTNAAKGHIKGQPLRFISGHNKRGTARLDRYEPVKGGYASLCWRWLGTISRKGYGVCQVGGIKKNAHRALYERAHGPLDRRIHVDHLCRNKWCVNPAHGEPVTPLVNERRKRAALKPTSDHLIKSAAELVERMLSVECA